jgi:N-glycosidase YbiA
MALKFYKLNDPGGYMSNFYRSKLTIYGRTWATVEHAYQAQKCLDDKEYNEIHEAKTPRIARNLGQQVKMRKDWDSVKYSVMEECVRAKFTQDEFIRKELLATGDEELIEDSPVDSYWGCGADGRGQNMLGKILMKIREELKNV